MNQPSSTNPSSKSGLTILQRLAVLGAIGLILAIVFNVLR